jgi:hypothetical protein
MKLSALFNDGIHDPLHAHETRAFNEHCGLLIEFDAQGFDERLDVRKVLTALSKIMRSGFGKFA